MLHEGPDIEGHIEVRAERQALAGAGRSDQWLEVSLSARRSDIMLGPAVTYDRDTVVELRNRGRGMLNTSREICGICIFRSPELTCVVP